ncbi:MAG: hypothetical protein J6J70_01960, partial [Methanocorpusculaceae archaeon]|nr:hypothetical protein [Methanocorpusculaceae archaeon]
MITDACICPDVSSAFSLSDFSKTAYENGYRRVIVCDAEISEDMPFDVVLGKRISAKTAKELLGAVRKAPKGALVIADAGDNSFNRT